MRFLWVLGAVLAGAGALALRMVAVARPMVRMPGRSFRGPLPPLSDSERDLTAKLKRQVDKLAVEIGTRSLLFTPRSLERAAAYLKEELESFGYQVTNQRFQISYGTDDSEAAARSPAALEGINVIAELPGQGTTGEVIVVGAHYDSVPDCPGANDNGSGVAAMLEIARALKDKRLARSVRFVAFTNEEQPFARTKDMGSTQYARLCHETGDKVVAMLSLETIGCYSDVPGSQQYPKPFNLFYPNAGNFVAFVGNITSRELVHRCISLFREHANFPSQGLSAPEYIRGVDFSDHLSFWQYGYPALMVTDTAFYRYQHYHTRDDTPDKIDFERLARVTAGLTRVIEELAG